MRWMLPLLLVIMAGAAGAGAGYFLRPASETAPEDALAEAEGLISYYRMPNQFVVPLLENGRMSAVVVMSLTLQIEGEPTEQLTAQEPKLRDEFLRVMFDTANAGGFRGNFTSDAQVGPLRRSLLEAARKVSGPGVMDILITDLLRQDH